MACAQTGSVKTAGFLLPMIQRILTEGIISQDNSQQNTPRGPRRFGKSRSKYCIQALVLSPTRELAQQIHFQSRKFLYRTGICSVVVYGGLDIREQFRALDKGCELLVATPGRLWDFMERQRITLAHCTSLCLDEADRMLDMGFEPRIRQIV